MAEAPTSSIAKAPRDYRLDFFRGLALVFIFIDHIPNNFLRYFTLHSVAFCDAAEMFIFISGYTAALVYGRALLREGKLMMTARVYRRVWQLYVAHLCIFLMFNAEVSYTMLHFNNPLFADELQVGSFLDEPGVTLIRVLLLQFQPSLLNILPLYISLLIVFPLILIALRRHPAMALVPTVALYLAVQRWGINLPGYPADTVWYFDPLAYLLLFTIGAACGLAQVQGGVLLEARRWLLWLSWAAVAAGAFVALDWTLHQLIPAIPLPFNVPVWADDKTAMGPLRLMSMLSMAYLVAALVPRTARFLTGRLGWMLVLCGQNSLYIFCLTILLAVLANLVFTVVGSGLVVQIMVNISGLLLMFALSALLSWFSSGGRLPPRPVVRAMAPAEPT